MSVALAIELPLDKIKEFCQRNPIDKLSVFGSILREDFNSESDVDLLVEFTPGSQIGYFEIVDMELELTDLIGRKVDLRTLAEISRYFRQKVLDSAQVLHVP